MPQHDAADDLMLFSEFQDLPCRCMPQRYPAAAESHRRCTQEHMFHRRDAGVFEIRELPKHPGSAQLRLCIARDNEERTGSGNEISVAAALHEFGTHLLIEDDVKVPRLNVLHTRCKLREREQRFDLGKGQRRTVEVSDAAPLFTECFEVVICHNKKHCIGGSNSWKARRETLYYASLRASYNGYYGSFPSFRRGFDSPRPLHPASFCLRAELCRDCRIKKQAKPDAPA